jgi:hypothetical protein
MQHLGNIVGFRSGQAKVQERAARRQKRGLPAD